jgi:ABC-type phosphate transport system substrate-binding protein
MKKLFLILILLSTTSTAYSEMMIISHKSVPNRVFSRQEIKDIFMGKKLYWDDKSKIAVATMADDSSNSAFLQAYLEQNPKQYNGYWEKRIFTGDKDVPKRVKTAKSMIDYIASTRGAVGFIDAPNAPANVNVLKVSN